MKNILLLFLVSISFSLQAKEYEVFSPNKQIKATINVDDETSLRVFHENVLLFELKDIYLEIDGKGQLGRNAKVKKINTIEIKEHITPFIKEKKALLENWCNELDILFKNKYGIRFRVYNNGIAYRFYTTLKKEITVKKENLEFINTGNDSLWFQTSPTFLSSYETPYQKKHITDIEKGTLCNLPILIMKGNGERILMAESDLTSYPGLWFKGTGKNALEAAFPPVPKKLEESKTSYSRGRVETTHDYIAKTSGSRSFPWRLFVIESNDGALLNNDLVYILAPEQKIQETKWIEPGVVTFDWWGRRNIYGVDFEAGINTATAKYFIDFCVEYGYKYFLFDDGWSSLHNVLEPIPELDMKEVMAYADKKGVGIMLWVHWYGLKVNMMKALDIYEKWGVRGIKVDFMNRDDQQMVDFYEELASETARRKMVLNFHGAYKPAGLRRAYPNLLTREALIEFEYNGWKKDDTPKHHNLLPYLRLVTGPMDYIPATMRNGTKHNFRPIGDYPMGQGTRTHAIALFVILSSPMTMLPDSPSDYYREEECTRFISKIPVEWDELKILHAKIGEYTVLARRSGEDWYLAAITNWDQRSIEIDFSFLDSGTYELEYLRDGINANTRAQDYVLEKTTVSSDKKIKIDMASGGGWIGRLVKK